MAVDHVESQPTHQAPPSAPTDPQNVHSVLDSIPVNDARQTYRHRVMDTVARETEDPAPPGESRSLQVFLTAFPWVAFSLAILAVVYLARRRTTTA